MKPAATLKRFQGIAEAAAFLGVVFTLAGLLGRYVWFLEIATHFKLQLALCFFGYALLELAARRSRRACASLALAAVNAFPALLLLLPAPSAASPATPQQHAACLRILQANVLSGNTNAPALLALVASENPDVVVLQEPTMRWLSDLEPLTNSYPVFATWPRGDNFGAAIYCKSNALKADIFRLSDPEGLPSTRARIAVNGRMLTVVGTHAHAPKSDAMWRSRNGFMLELARVLRAVKDPVVVTGDFNNTPWSAHYSAFLAASGLHDSAQSRGPLLTWPATFTPLARIPLDHCLYSDGVSILSRRPGPNIGSDHIPIIIDVAF